MRRGVMSCSMEISDVLVRVSFEAAKRPHEWGIATSHALLAMTCNMILLNQQSSYPEHEHACQYTTEDGHWHGFPLGILLKEFGDLVNHFKDSAGTDGKE